MTNAHWPGTPRKPAPRPPAAPAGNVWRGIAENLTALAIALVFFAAMLLLVQHVGSAPR
jgi:hypothetical protein